MALILIVVTIAVVITNSISPFPISKELASEKSLMVAVVFPGIADDVKQYSCDDYEIVEEVIPSGVDPHEAQLSPEKIRVIKDADIVIIGGHTPADIKSRDIARGIIINITGIKGLTLKTIPIYNVTNVHFPIYDPQNYLLFMENLIKYKINVQNSKCIDNTQCNYCINLYKSYIDTLHERINELMTYKSCAAGIQSVVDLPPAQYAIEWLGLRVKIILSPSGEVSSQYIKPSLLRRAEEVLTNGGVAVVTIDGDGKPISKVGEWLEENAKRLNASIIYVKSPFIKGTVTSKLTYIVGQIEAANLCTR
ncbi:MAG: zinc ABC transporter substrate-binding protein [Desulfurococcales archaeon]|nr:zinc ABC transporter substrate-binding protein [Desulfurococcales archaeon]